MLSNDGRFAIVYNGEIYNCNELRRELENAGVRFRSRGDTEVALHALTHWGERALARFNGCSPRVTTASTKRRPGARSRRHKIALLPHTKVSKPVASIDLVLDHP